MTVPREHLSCELDGSCCGPWSACCDEYDPDYELHVSLENASGADGDYFTRFGFDRIDRADLADALNASEELRGACPASAVIMRKRLE